MEEKMCKSNAKNDYYLTDKDLSKYTGTLVSRYKKPNYTMYHKADMIDAFCTKYNVTSDQIDAKLQELSNKKIARKTKKDDKKKNDQMKRKQLLVNALQEQGLELRNDSVLCEQYIEGDSGILKEWSINSIVERMCEMKYLYDYCHMHSMLDEAYHEQKEEREQGYYPDMSVAELAEMKALEKYSNNKYPNPWPWL